MDLIIADFILIVKPVLRGNIMNVWQLAWDYWTFNWPIQTQTAVTLILTLSLTHVPNIDSL